MTLGVDWDEQAKWCEKLLNVNRNTVSYPRTTAIPQTSEGGLQLTKSAIVERLTLIPAVTDTVDYLRRAAEVMKDVK